MDKAPHPTPPCPAPTQTLYSPGDLGLAAGLLAAAVAAATLLQGALVLLLRTCMSARDLPL
jgi:hypothetical protein